MKNLGILIIFFSFQLPVISQGKNDEFLKKTIPQIKGSPAQFGGGIGTGGSSIKVSHNGSSRRLWLSAGLKLIIISSQFLLQPIKL